MYYILKKLSLFVLPKGLLFKLEFGLRNFMYLFKYKGENYKCVVCEAELKNFVRLKEDALCPKCGSLKRTRFLKILIDQYSIKEDESFLHFTPHRYLMKLLKHKLNYMPSDFLGVNASNKFDITELPLQNNSLDVIVCYHILEHVPNDSKAMSELYRVIKPKGTVLLQVPFRDGKTIEDETITSPQERLKHFGQEDHVRWYGFDDFVNRLKLTGFIS
jgi:SAM-dependent methyltransferase